MHKDLPVLLAAGEQDPVGSYGAGVRRVEEKLRTIGIHQVDCILYPEDRHEILNELDREKVYADLGSWIIRQL